MGRLTGKTAFITGAGSGIGRAIADGFAREGARVFITDVDADGLSATAEIAGKHGGQVATALQDVIDEPAWDSLVAECQATLGPLDCLVNNAGICIGGPILSYSLSDFRRQQEVNIDSVFLGTRAAFKAMKGRGGSVINLSSIAGLKGSAGMSAYCASKGAVRLFTKSAAVEAGRLGYKIRVNSIHPGVIDTPIWQKEITGSTRLREVAVPEVAETMPEPGGANTMDSNAIGMMIAPLGRAGQPSEIADMAIFLASDESGYITGGEFVVDGGVGAT